MNVFQFWFQFQRVFDGNFSQMKLHKAGEVTLRAALEMKYMCSCPHILRHRC